VNGQRLTKAQVEARLQQLRTAPSPAGPAPAETQLLRRFEDAERARIAAENLKLAGQLPLLGSQPAARATKSTVDTTLSCSPPRIDATFQLPPIEPGEDFFLEGACFGTTKGSVLLLGNFFGGKIAAQILQWKPDVIHARVPEVSGVPDHPIALQVSAGGATSNQWPTTFRAHRTGKYFEPKDATVLQCHSPDPSSDFCKGLTARHAYSDLDWGIDKALVKLENGWEMEKLYVHESDAYYQSPPSQRIVAVSGLQPWSSQSTISVSWLYAGLGGLTYYVKIWIVGPDGIPHL
jgi:hypothetical protein